MAGLKELRTRLNAVRSTEKITTAMKLVATSKLKKATVALEKNKLYANLIENAVARVLLEYRKQEENKKIKHILPRLFYTKPNPQNYLLIVFSSERGLCGSYNQNVAKRAANRFRELKKSGKSVKMICYGKKAYDILKKNHKNDILYHEASFAGGGIFYDEAVQMLNKAKDLSSEKQFDVCEIVFSRFVSALQRELISMQIYPLDAGQIKTADDLDHIGEAYFDYKTSKEEVLEEASEKLLVNRVFAAMLNAEASEQSARMTAMDNATQNAADMIETLTLKYNTLRQSAITTELTEIISGAEAI